MPTKASADVGPANHPPSAAQCFGRWPQATAAVAAREGILMANKSPRKTNGKKLGKTLKEKQTAKRMKRIKQAGKTSNIPPTGH
jgi:hypothetical protein